MRAARDGATICGANGQPMKTKALGVLCLLPVLLPAAAAAQTATAIVAKVYAARGGLDKIRAIQSQRISGTITFGSSGSEASGPFFVELKRPLKMHMQLTVQNQTMIRIYDGKSAGWANNPFAGKMNMDVMNDEDLKNISEEADFDGPLIDYKRKGNQITLMGKDKVEDKDVWRIKLTTKNGDVRYYLFDQTSFLLLKWEGKRKYEDKEFPVESFFHDYRDVDGLKFAFEIDSGSSASEITQKIAIDNIELNTVMDDSEFAKPATPTTPEAPASAPSQQN
jgi:outer membrane lipoprotein-sorting protein